MVSWFLKEGSKLLAERMGDIIKMSNVAESWKSVESGSKELGDRAGVDCQFPRKHHKKT